MKKRGGWKVTSIIFMVLFFILLILSIFFGMGAITAIQDLNCDNSCLKMGYSGSDMEGWTNDSCGCYGNYMEDTSGGQDYHEYLYEFYLNECYNSNY